MSDGCVDSIAKNRLKGLTDKLTGASKGVGGLISNIERAIDDIERETDCEGLKSKISLIPDKLETAIEGTLETAQQVASKFIKLAKLPKSLKGVITFAKDLIIGTIAPQLQAYIRLTQDLIKLTQTLSRLTSVIENVLPRLQQCAIDAINEEIYGLQSQIDIQINTVILNLSKQINEQLCEIGPGLQELGALLNDATVNTSQLVQQGRSLELQADSAISNTLSTIGTIGNSLTQIAPITFNIDTSSAEAFNESIANGAFDEFTNSVEEFRRLVGPSNTSAPATTGTVQLGETLTASTGTWEGDDITFAYQWYRNDVPIHNATAATYQLTSQDGNGTKIYCEVNATNVAGEDAAQTPAITTTFVTGGLFSFGQRVM